MRNELGLNLRPGFEYETNLDVFFDDSTPMVMEAFRVAREVHSGEKRKVGGEPYFNHCVAVASILRSWGADEEEVAAGLLHDTIENHPDKITIEDIRNIFGDRVAQLVEGVTKLKTRENETGEFETLKKVTKESFIEPGVALVKLADRLHNMSTMEGMKPEVQIKKANETLTVYAPLAESFGMWLVKICLEDLSFRYIDPERYEMVRRLIDGDNRLTREFICRRVEEVEEVLEKNGISAKVEYQVGGYWELSEKQRHFGMRASAKMSSFADITDVISFRVITDSDSISECYKAMGVVREFFDGKLMKRRHNDYLVTPSTNGYSALHDTYHFPEGDVEIAFATAKREVFNNWGVISLDKEELRLNAEKYVRKLIFTPKRELVFMEKQATAIDIAYKLNPLLGLRAVGVIVDGRTYGLDYVVPNASVMEILCNQEQNKPNLEWLRFCSFGTRRIIEQQLLVSQRDEDVIRGKEILFGGLLAERGIINLADLDGKLIDKLMMDLGCWNGLSDLYYKVAFGFNLNVVRKKLDEYGIVRGMYTSVQVQGVNALGVSRDIAEIISRNGGDMRSKVERVTDTEEFIVRVLLMVDYEGKKNIERELKEKYYKVIIV